MKAPRNCVASIKGDKLVIEVDVGKASLEAAPPSSTGKTKLVGTTSGMMAVPGKVNGLSFSLNVMVPAV